MSDTRAEEELFPTRVYLLVGVVSALAIALVFMLDWQLPWQLPSPQQRTF